MSSLACHLQDPKALLNYARYDNACAPIDYRSLFSFFSQSLRDVSIRSNFILAPVQFCIITRHEISLIRAHDGVIKYFIVNCGIRDAEFSLIAGLDG